MTAIKVALLKHVNPLDVRSRYTGFEQTSLRRRKSVYRRHGMSTPGARSRYTGGMLCQRQAPEVGIPTLFSKECPIHRDTDKTAAEK